MMLCGSWDACSSLPEELSLASACSNQCTFGADPMANGMGKHSLERICTRFHPKHVIIRSHGVRQQTAHCQRSLYLHVTLPTSHDFISILLCSISAECTSGKHIESITKVTSFGALPCARPGSPALKTFTAYILKKITSLLQIAFIVSAYNPGWARSSWQNTQIRQAS